jgi:histidyl-tRNA synthetase
VDAEIIAMTIHVYKELALTEYSLKINSVGCEKCRPHYREVLQTELRTIALKLSPDSQRRIEDNPMRVLDSKDENDRKFTAAMPMITNYLCAECAGHFEDVKKYLHAFNISFTVDGRLVRGLDYYTKTAFELTSPVLGSQDALAGGGRYDLLTHELGGKATPGVGFAAGIERLMMVLEKKGSAKDIDIKPLLYIAAADDVSREWILSTAIDLRAKGIAVESDLLRRSLKAQMRDADRQQAAFVIVVGQQERESGKAALKNMQTGEQKEVILKDIAMQFSQAPT